ncbi:hypothetical protein BRC81_06470 [Halobacteriales archaeon QS_1_68_20]|nr:MAG: hypothetical protein BRC81_06470 [Halobacteriales archaeon QS_1_68_20]
MRRRQVLAAVPALLAGCTGSDDETPSPTESTPETTPTPTTAPPTTEPPTETPPPYDRIPADPASLTAEEVEARLADRDCTELVEVPAICPGDDRLAVSVDPSVADLADGVVEFTVENRADEVFETNHYGWLLQKFDGTRWRHIAPLRVPMPSHTIAPGDSHTHRIEPVPSKVARTGLAYTAQTDITIGGLGPGVYGFSTEGRFGLTSDEEVAPAAVFGFAGEAPPVEPTEHVNDVELDGSELVVRSDAPREERGEVLITLSDDEPDDRLLPEHVRQLAGLRNTIPFAATDGVERIRYVGSDQDESIVDRYLEHLNPGGVDLYGFREYVFEVTAEG